MSKNPEKQTTLVKFEVCKERINDARLREPIDRPNQLLKQQWERIAKNQSKFYANRVQPQKPGFLEAHSSLDSGHIIASEFSWVNIFAKTVLMSYFEHLPLRLSPDVIWLTIAQGFGHHVNLNAEELRDYFVEHEGKKKLSIFRPGIVKGNPNNDWPSCFPEFSRLIGENVKEKEIVDTLECNFSTSGPLDLIASQIGLMDCMQGYFEYEVCCGCGIPLIELTGTTQDWIKLREKAKLLARYKFSWYINDVLMPVLDHFVSVAKGEAPDALFWNSMCQLRGASGMFSGTITGWLQTLYPYIMGAEKMVVNKSGSNWKQHYESGKTAEEIMKSCYGMFGSNDLGYGLDLDNYPTGISEAPFVLKNIMTGESWDMSFNAGFIAIEQDPESLAIEPVVGWAVLDRNDGQDLDSIK